MTELSTNEARLIAVHRAIEKFGNSNLIDTVDSSAIHAYVVSIMDLDHLEEIAQPDQIEYFLDGIITGIAVYKLLASDVPPGDIPIPRNEKNRQFQTGVAPDGHVRVNKQI